MQQQSSYRIYQLLFSSVWLVALTTYFFLWDINPDLVIFSRDAVVLITVLGFAGAYATWWIVGKIKM
ncbi:MAG: hypothetical protein WC289_05015 [Patescibacteria group bacterium]|jgi:hypothetical protein